MPVAAKFMSFITTNPDHRYPWYVRLILALQRRRYGAELEPARLWGRTPKVFAAQSLLYRALERKDSPIEPALRSLILVRVSQINWCEFCIDLNSANALQRYVPLSKLDALGEFENSALYSERERAALAYAEAMTDSNVKADEGAIARLRAHFSEEAVFELSALIAFQNLSSKFNAALGVAPQGFCQRPRAAD